MTDRRYEVVALIGPCSYDQAKHFLIHVDEQVGDDHHLGAVWSLQAFEEAEPTDPAVVEQELLDALEAQNV